LTVDADLWPSDEDPEDEIFEELIWSVMEEHPGRHVLVAEQVEPAADDDLGVIFDGNYRIDSGWLSHVSILYRNEGHEPTRLVDRWAPSSLMPLEVLREKDPPEFLDWLSEHYPDGAPSRIHEMVIVRNLLEQDRIRMELLDRDSQVIINTQHYFSTDGEMVLVERFLVTAEHLLYLRPKPPLGACPAVRRTRQ
jgi:hypothetical protein